MTSSNTTDSNEMESEKVLVIEKASVDTETDSKEIKATEMNLASELKQNEEDWEKVSGKDEKSDEGIVVQEEIDNKQDENDFEKDDNEIKEEMKEEKNDKKEKLEEAVALIEESIVDDSVKQETVEETPAENKIEDKTTSTENQEESTINKELEEEVKKEIETLKKIEDHNEKLLEGFTKNTAQTEPDLNLKTDTMEMINNFKEEEKKPEEKGCFGSFLDIFCCRGN